MTDTAGAMWWSLNHVLPFQHSNRGYSWCMIMVDHGVWPSWNHVGSYCIRFIWRDRCQQDRSSKAIFDGKIHASGRLLALVCPAALWRECSCPECSNVAVTRVMTCSRYFIGCDSEIGHRSLAHRSFYNCKSGACLQWSSAYKFMTAFHEWPTPHVSLDCPGSDEVLKRLKLALVPFQAFSGLVPCGHGHTQNGIKSVGPSKGEPFVRHIFFHENVTPSRARRMQPTTSAHGNLVGLTP